MKKGIKINKIESSNQKQIRYINGVKTYFKAGVWYCDWNHYKKVKERQGLKTNIEMFCLWCNHWDLQPTG